MPVTDVQHDLENLTLTITADFAAPVQRIWQVYADPRQLEKVWGPPTHPATFVDHEFTPGGRAAYFMTAPDGQKYHGWWRFEEIEPPGHLRFEDGFADDQGNPNTEMPTTVATVTITEAGGATTMAIQSKFSSREGMEQTIEMGMEQGVVEALGQVDALLAA
jgi:uncharacterized protein YndB with AHSA1/START domain